MRRLRGWMGRCAAVVMILCAAACAKGREYDLQGQVLAVDPARGEVTVKHDDIRGFMPGMTMAFKVRDTALLTGRTPGELIRATLVVNDTEVYMKAITSTGRAALTEPPPRPRIDPLAPGEPVPDVAFVDELGRPRRLTEWRGRVVAVTFIYTRCPMPDFCPLMDRQFADLQRALKEDAQLRDRVQLLSVSFDPSFDTPAVLAAHGKALGADPALWHFVTGDGAAIEAFAGRFGVAVMREGASPTDVVHNLRTGVIDGNGTLVTIFNGIQWQPSDLVTELRTVVGAR